MLDWLASTMLEWIYAVFLQIPVINSSDVLHDMPMFFFSKQLGFKYFTGDPSKQPENPCSVLLQLNDLYWSRGLFIATHGEHCLCNTRTSLVVSFI